MINIADQIAAYERHKNLKVAADELGMKWQTLYYHLRNAGVSVTGDKERYGSKRDKLATLGESYFQADVPFAVSNNGSEFQSKYDFSVGNLLVEIKTARKTKSNKNYGNSKRWSFCLKKQSISADFFICYAMGEDADNLEKVFLIPGEVCVGMQTLSITASARSKWSDYEVTRDDLFVFFSGFQS